MIYSQYVIENHHQKIEDSSAVKTLLNGNQKIYAKKQNLLPSSQSNSRNIEDSEIKSQNIKKEALDNSKSLMKKIQELNQLKETLKSEEISRIMGISLTDEKQSGNLEKRFRVLFGKKETELLLDEFKKEKLV